MIAHAQSECALPGCRCRHQVHQDQHRSREGGWFIGSSKAHPRAHQISWQTVSRVESSSWRCRQLAEKELQTKLLQVEAKRLDGVLSLCCHLCCGFEESSNVVSAVHDLHDAKDRTDVHALLWVVSGEPRNALSAAQPETLSR